MGAGVAVGSGVGVGVGDGVGVGTGAEASRITMSVGRVLKFPGEAVNPKETVPPTGTALFQLAPAMVYLSPLLAWMLAFQIEAIAGAIVKSTLQSEIGFPVVFVTCTSAWNPLPQSLVTANAAEASGDLRKNAQRKRQGRRTVLIEAQDLVFIVFIG